MKTKIGILVLALCTSFINLQAQRRVMTTRAMSYDISDNLDLDAVASIFGDSENLEDFEYRLNDPDNRISNLDLNEDGYIDYLRVVENSSDRNSLVVIQAVLDRDVYQDVATIEIERVRNGNPHVQIVGNAYIYGSNYIIEPIYVHSPLIFSFFWSPRYVTYHSPYYWDYYPGYFRYYRPYSPYKYHRHIDVHINRYNTYQRTTERRLQFSGDNYSRIRRNDYAERYPNRAFESRNQGVKNRYELDQRRPSSQVNRNRNDQSDRFSDPVYQNNRSSSSRRSEPSERINSSRRYDSNVQSAPSQGRVRENSPVEYKRNSSGSSNAPVQINSRSRQEGSAVSRPNRPENRIESSPRSAAPREKSGSISGNSRSNNEVKQAPRVERQSESNKKEERNENGNGRRR